MPCVFSFDVDGTTEWGGGPIPADVIRQLHAAGHTIVGGSGHDETTQRNEFAAHGIPLAAVPQKQRLGEIHTQLPADRYFHIGDDLIQDGEAAFFGQFEYLPPPTFLAVVSAFLPPSALPSAPPVPATLNMVPTIPPPRPDLYPPQFFSGDTDWNLSYGWRFSFTGKVVMDIGASDGDTAWYFLTNGAKRVIAVEMDDRFFAQLVHNYTGDSRVVPIQATLGRGAMLEVLLTTFMPDLVKMDCEGGEVGLLDCPVPVIRSVKEWIIEVHPPEIEQQGIPGTGIDRCMTEAGFFVMRSPFMDFGERAYLMYAVREALDR